MKQTLGAICLVASCWACEAPRADLDPKSDQQPAPASNDTTALAETHPIVFCSDRDSPGVGDLYALSADGSSAQRLTNGGDFWLPRWSPDARSILFRQQIEGLVAEVGLILSDGSDLVRLTEGEDAVQFFRPANWSPDGEHIAFASLDDPEDSASLRLFTINTHGGGRTRALPDGTALQMEIAWSLPDGARVAYTDGTLFAPNDVWLADAADPSRATNLTEGRIFAPAFIAWSPDASQIALTGYAIDADGQVEGLGDHMGAGSGAPDDEIFVIDVESGAIRRITDNEAADYAPAFTPDGHGLLFSSDRDGDVDLWLVDLTSPDDARNLIDDNADPHEDSLGHWYLGQH